MTAPSDATHCIKTDFHIAYYKPDGDLPGYWFAYCEHTMDADRWFPVRLTAQQTGKLEKLKCHHLKTQQ